MKRNVLPCALSTTVLSGQRTSRLFLLLVLSHLSLAWSGCSKEGPKPQTPAENLQVSFSNNTIEFSLVDSGTVIFKKEGSQTPILKRFTKGNKTLEVMVGDLLPGNYAAEIYVFGRLPNGPAGITRRYVQQVGFTLPYTQAAAITTPGPDGGFRNNWKPHAVLSDAARSIVLTVPLDCRDPYFEFIVNDTRWDYLYIDRVAFKRNGTMNELMASGKWECDQACYGADRFIGNKTAFAPFVQLLTNKEWDNADIDAIAINQATGEEVVLFYHFNKP